MEIRINLVEAASELAHRATVDEVIADESMDYDCEEDVWVHDDENDIDTYHDDVQDVFNCWYDYFCGMLEYCNLDKVKEDKDNG